MQYHLDWEQDITINVKQQQQQQVQGEMFLISNVLQQIMRLLLEQFIFNLIPEKRDIFVSITCAVFISKSIQQGTMGFLIKPHQYSARLLQSSTLIIPLWI